MPKIPRLTSRQIIRVLEKKGFVLDRSKGSHQIFIHPETRRRAIVPWHRKNLPIGTQLSILKQAGIDRDELVDLL
jgi:predicted RNA binding protein YcfA (HicA-like mRNA interferase family)